jgi:hypothetical protein
MCGIHTNNSSYLLCYVVFNSRLFNLQDFNAFNHSSWSILLCDITRKVRQRTPAGLRERPTIHVYCSGPMNSKNFMGKVPFEELNLISLELVWIEYHRISSRFCCVVFNWKVQRYGCASLQMAFLLKKFFYDSWGKFICGAYSALYHNHMDQER